MPGRRVQGSQARETLSSADRILLVVSLSLLVVVPAVSLQKVEIPLLLLQVSITLIGIGTITKAAELVNKH